MIIKFLSKRFHPADIDELESIRHEARNAIAGLLLERRILLSEVAKYINRSDTHICRIEAALKRHEECQD